MMLWERHSGARAKRGSPESITTAGEYRFRARAFGAPRNDKSITTVREYGFRARRCAASRNDAVDGLAAFIPQQRYQRIPAPAFEHVRRALVVLFPALEVLHRIVHLAPGGEHESAHAVGILDGVVRGDRRAERHRDEHRPLY